MPARHRTAEDLARHPPAEPSTNHSPGPDASTGEFYLTYREECIQTLLKLFPKTEEEGTLSRTFYEATTNLRPKPDKDTKKKEHCRAVSGMNTDVKSLNKVLVNGI